MEEEIREKAEYCLNCIMKPCSKKGCPLGNDIPNVIKAVKEEKYKKAYEILSETTVLQSICGRICPHIKQCQGSCIRGIKSESVSIGQIEAFVGDIAIKENYKIAEKNTKNKDKRIAIIGGGPAGLTASAFLLKMGYDVTIYEKYDYLGGLLVHGIPEFRLPKDIVSKTIQKIIDLGLKINYNKELGQNLILEKLESEYDAIFLAIGANIPLKMGIKGEELEGVYGGNQLLEKKNHPIYDNKSVAVIGGGNVAIDCARTIKRLGAKDVKIIYRRSEHDMPAEKDEIDCAKKDGIELVFQNNLIKILGKNKVEQIELIKTELIKQENKRPKPVNIPKSNYKLDIDYVIMALGSIPEEYVKDFKLELTNSGYIKVNEKNQTSNPKIFAGGDLIGEIGTVAWASRSGRDCAIYIDEYLN